MVNVANTPPTEPNFFTWLWTQGPTIVFLALCVYVVGRALIARNQQLDQSKQDRLEDHKQRIEKLEGQNERLEKRVDDCEEDRTDLRRQLTELKRQ